MSMPSDLAAPPSPRRVLLVDDDAPLREAVERGLAKAGFHVTAAGSGAEALEVARTLRLDAAIIDVMLPDAGGLGLARELRRDPRLASLPVLFITALSLPVVMQALAPAPVLLKPFTYRQLPGVLRQVVG